MADLSGIQVHYVNDLDTAGRFLTWLGERRPVLAVDTETTGLKWWEPNFTRLLQFGDGQQGWAIPVRLWRGLCEQALTSVAENRTPTVFHNIKFDLHALEGDGYPLPYLPYAHDTSTMHRLLEPSAGHHLKGIASHLLGPAAVAGQGLLKIEMAKHGWTWATVPEDLPAYWAYGALDTVLTALVGENLWPRLHAAGYRDVYEREMAVQMILYRAERRGLRIDAEYTDTLRQEWRREAAELRTHLEAAGIENPNSNAQVEKVLRDAGWEPDEFTDTGKAKLDKVVLSILSKEYGDIAPQLLRYKRLVKWTSTYLDTFLVDADSRGYVHASINTSAARTGRMSITGPPLQTLPRGPFIRNCVVPDDGHALFSIDYDTMEMRKFAHYTQDPALIEAIRRGEDLHTFCASMAYNVAPEQVTKEQRQVAKNTNFSRIYGAGPAKIAATAGVSEAEIRAYLAGFDARFPEAARFIQRVEALGKVRLASEGEPYIVTSGGRRLPSAPTKIYALLNYLIQGGCADLFKTKIVELDKVGLGDNIILPVHDELLFQFPTDQGTDMAQTARDVMEDHTTFSVPMTCGVDGPLSRWGDKYAE